MCYVVNWALKNPVRNKKGKMMEKNKQTRKTNKQKQNKKTEVTIT